MRPEFGFQIAPDCFWNDIIIKFFDVFFFFVSLIKFSYWSKFHVNIVTGSGVLTIFFYKGLTRNPEIGNTLVWVLPNIWRLGQVEDTKISTNVSNKKLLNAAKWPGYSCYCFWVIKGKKQEGGGKITPPPTQIRLMEQKLLNQKQNILKLQHILCV